MFAIEGLVFTREMSTIVLIISLVHFENRRLIVFRTIGEQRIKPSVNLSVNSHAEKGLFRIWGNSLGSSVIDVEQEIVAINLDQL
jgi:hypothetical protein